MKLHTRRAVCAALLASALSVFAFAGTASAKLTGEYTVFQQCPYTSAETNRCLFSVTKGGEVILGKKKVPIVNPVTLQGGYTEPVEEFSKLIPAKNGVTLSKTPQPVPGGLAGLVNCKEISNFLLRISCEVTFENGLTGVNTTLELAKPVSEVRLSEVHLAEEEEVALKMPVKVHLENPLLGSSCYVGSSSSPIVLELTSGSTSPPPPNTSITGTAGKFEFLENNRILRLSGAKLVDNAWSAPGASGCGGFLVELLLDPIINASVGVPSAAGHNTAILENNISIATAIAVKKNDETNP
jgi:hypothetical protein